MVTAGQIELVSTTLYIISRSDLMITHTCCYSYIISLATVVAFLSVTDKTEIRTPQI